MENKDLKQQIADDFLNTAYIDTSNSGSLEIKYMDLVSDVKDSVKDKDTNFGEGKVKELKIKLFSKFVELSNHQVSSMYSDQMANDINYLHGIDFDAMTSGVIIEEAHTNKHKKLVKLYSELAKKSEDEYIDSSKCRRFIKKINPKINFPVYIGDNYSTEAVRTLIKNIILRSNLLAVRSRIGQADFIIVGSEIGSMIQDSPGFVYNNPVEVNLNPNPSRVKLIGNIAGRIKVFVDPYMKFNDKRVILGKQTKKDHPGVYFIENPGSEEFTKVDLPDGGKKMVLK